MQPSVTVICPGVSVVIAEVVNGVVVAVVTVVRSVVVVLVVGSGVVVAMPALKAMSMATLSSLASIYALLYVAPREGHTLFCEKGNEIPSQHSS